MYQNIERSELNDTIFHLVALETIDYILMKQDIDSKQKLAEVEDFGAHLGERIANHLNNLSSNSSTKMEVDDIMKFLGRDVWYFVFGKNISKLQTNHKGTFLIDCEEIKFHYNLLTEKNSIADEGLDNVLNFASGIIKGVINSFNIECTVQATFRPQTIINNVLSPAGSVLPSSRQSMTSTMSFSSPSSGNPTVFPYSFTITILSSAAK